MFYEVRYNDPVKAGFVTPGQEYYINAKFSNDDLDLMGVIAGNSADLPGNDPATGQAPHPFTSFAETIATEATIKPWILDPDSIALLAEAALEGRIKKLNESIIYYFSLGYNSCIFAYG